MKWFKWRNIKLFRDGDAQIHAKIISSWLQFQIEERKKLKKRANEITTKNNGQTIEN